MISIKEAINIFEQYKIDWFRGTPFGNFNGHQFGTERPTSFCLGPTEKGHHIMGKNLLHYINRRYPDSTFQSIIPGELQLYGKKNNPSIEGKTYNELEYIRIYLDFPEMEDETLELGILTNLDWIRTQLFENYDYKTMYNPSTNYTVMGNRKTNNIQYVDISVDNKEFKEFLDNLYKEL